MSLNTVARNAFVVGSLALLSWALPYFANAELAQSVSCTSPLLQQPTSLWLSNGGNNWVPPLSLTYNNKVVLLYRPPLNFGPSVSFIDGYTPTCVLAGADDSGAISVLSFCRPNLIEAYVNLSPNISTPLLCTLDPTVYSKIYSEAQNVGMRLIPSVYYNIDFVGDANMFSNAFLFQNYAIMSAAYASVFLYQSSKGAQGSQYQGVGLRVNSLKYLSAPIWTPGVPVTSQVFTTLQNIETNNGAQQPSCQFGVYIMSNDSTSLTKGFMKTPVAPITGLNLAVYQSAFSDRMYPRMLDRFGNYLSLLMNALGVSYDYPAYSSWMPSLSSQQLQTLVNSLNQVNNFYSGTTNTNINTDSSKGTSGSSSGSGSSSSSGSGSGSGSSSSSGAGTGTGTSTTTTSTTASQTSSSTSTNSNVNISPASRFCSMLVLSTASVAAVVGIMQYVL